MGLPCCWGAGRGRDQSESGPWDGLVCFSPLLLARAASIWQEKGQGGKARSQGRPGFLVTHFLEISWAPLAFHSPQGNMCLERFLRRLEPRGADGVNGCPGGPGEAMPRKVGGTPKTS